MIRTASGVLGRIFGASALLASIILASSVASANDPATAQTLFDQARKLMTQERWADACPKLEESQRLDPGGGTLLHLALCREHEGKIATAWAHYQDALSQAKRDNRKDRAKIAQSRIDALGPRLPRMRIKVASKNRKLSGFRVSRDDANVGDAQWGDPFPVDPGPHNIKAIADGYKTWSSNVQIAASPNETSVDVPELDVDPSAQSPITTTVSSSPPSNSGGDTGRITRDQATDGDGQRTIGIVLGGVGAVGVVVGSIVGFMSISKQKEADNQCKGPDFKVCTPAGKATGDDATTLGTVSTISFIAGGALLVGGAALYFTAPEAKKSKPRTGNGQGVSLAVTPALGGVSIAGAF